MDSVAKRLSEDWREGETPDLSDCLLLTQTKEAGRRLMRALALLADEAGGGLFPPLLGSPASLFRGGEGEEEASDLACLLCWEEVLGELQRGDFPNLFPAGGFEASDLAWRRSMAKALHGLRKILSECDRGCSEVAETNEEGFDLREPERWEDLAALEKLFLERLEERGLRDPFLMARKAARTPSLPSEVKRVVLAGVSGFPGLAEVALEALLARGVEVEILAFGPQDESFAGLFDDWGRPLRAAWEERPLLLDEECLRLLPDERAQARAVTEAVVSMGAARVEQVALGVVDAAVKPWLRRMAEEVAVEVVGNAVTYSEPEGTPASGSSLFAVLAALSGLVEDASFRRASSFLRFPEVRRWLDGVGAGVEERELLKELDRLTEKAIPGRLSDVENLARPDGVREVFRRLLELTEALRDGRLVESLREFLQEAYGEEEFSGANARGAAFTALAPELFEALETIEGFGATTGGNGLALLLDSLRGRRLPEVAETSALPMRGWLELPWVEAPWLLLVGFNEGCVPEALPGNAFLPESLRKDLGLWTDQDRFARDAYLLHWLTASRRGEAVGRVDILLGKWSMEGEPLKPSRLLFLCDEDDEEALALRVRNLFREPARKEEIPAWRFPWKLDPGPPLTRDRLSVTGFGDFLSCPYRFHLKKNLRMEPFDASKVEADARDFGSLTHLALEDFGRDEDIRESDDSVAIRTYLFERLEVAFFERFGRRPGLALSEQKKSILLRLEAFAEVQVEERRAGWVPIEAEGVMDADLNGFKVTGRIDRIDRHEETGAWRILDYKTSDKSPEENHWGPGTNPEAYPDYCLFEAPDARGVMRTKRWTGLQLPLYRWWALSRADFEGKSVSVGYFNLPPECAGVKVVTWDALDDDLMKAAMKCAAGVAEDLKAEWTGEPRSTVKYDDYEGLFFHDAVEASAPLKRREK